MNGRPALEVADIFREHGPAWREAQRGHLSLVQLKVMSAIVQCRCRFPFNLSLSLFHIVTDSLSRSHVFRAWEE